MRGLLGRLGQNGVNQPVAYTSRPDGKHHTSRSREMFKHVVNHAIYHRGQVTMMLRLLGATPVDTDLIRFDDRER